MRFLISGAIAVVFAMTTGVAMAQSVITAKDLIKRGFTFIPTSTSVTYFQKGTEAYTCEVPSVQGSWADRVKNGKCEPLHE